MADSELGELRRPPRAVEDRLMRMTGFRRSGMAGGTSDTPYPVGGNDGITVDDSDTGSEDVTPDWFSERFALTGSSSGVISLTNTPIERSEVLALNGVQLVRNVNYTIDGNRVTLDDLDSPLLGIGSDTWTMSAVYPYFEGAEDAYPDLVLADGALGYWRLGEESGTVMVDSSGNGHDGVYDLDGGHGEPGLLVASDDTAHLFTSADRGAVGPGTWIDTGSTFTVDAVIKPDEVTGEHTVVAMFDGYYTGTLRFVLRVYDSHLRMDVGDGSSTATVTGATTLAADTTYHVAGSYDGSTLRVYVNGTLDGSTDDALDATYPTDGTGISIGSNWTAVSDDFVGTIDEVAYYGTTLTAARIALHADTALGTTSSTSDTTTGTTDPGGSGSDPGTGSPGSGDPDPGPSGMTLVLDEDFAGALNTAIWDVENSDYGAPQRVQWYRPANVVVSTATSGGSGNSLKLISKREAYNGKAFTAGMVSTRDLDVFYPVFGRYAARMKIPHCQGVWPAFWLRHRDGSNTCEVDIMEYFHAEEPGKGRFTLHRKNNAGTYQSNVSHRAGFFEAPTLTPGWHVFAVDILPESGDVRFIGYVDDVEVWTYLDTQADFWSGTRGLSHPSGAGGAEVFDICLQGSQINGNYVGHPDDRKGYSRNLGRCISGGTAPSCSTSVGGYDIWTDADEHGGTGLSTGLPFEVDWVKVWSAL